MLFNLLRLGVVVLFPMAGIAWVGDIRADPEIDLTRPIEALCLIAPPPASGLRSETAGASTCDVGRLVWAFEGVAWLSLVTALLPLFLFFGLGRLCGRSRRLNTAIFPRLVPAGIALIVINLLAQGALILVGVVLSYVLNFGNPPVVIVLFTAAGIVAAAIGVISGAATLSVTPRLRAVALPLPEKRAGKIWSEVRAAAEAVGTSPPHQIVLGFEPRIWVVEGSILIPPDPGKQVRPALEGRVLHLSLPLLRMLTVEELRAVLAHEFAHLTGRDGTYTTRFVPVFSALSNSEIELSDDDPDRPPPALVAFLTMVARWPTTALLALLPVAFRRNVEAIAIHREADADRSACEAASPKAVAVAIMKQPLYGRLWNEMLKDHVGRIRLKKPIARELSLHFDDLARLLVSEDMVEGLRAYALKARVSHPFDIHPPCLKRLRTIGIRPALVSAKELRVGPEEETAAALLNERLRAEMEFALSELTNEALKDEGRIREIPVQGKRPSADPLYDAAYSVLAIAVAAADDQPVRFGVAAELADAEMTDFDRLAFAEYCRGRRPVQSLENAIGEVVRGAGEEGGEILLELLEKTLTTTPSSNGGPDGDDSLLDRARHIAKIARGRMTKPNYARV
ncbi:MAG: M48 family metallopeptidase [Pseudomonadota bacterium]